METISEDIQLVDRTSEDDALWRKVFEEWAKEYFAGLQMGPEQLESIIAMQYEAQCADYSSNYPAARSQVVVFKGEKVGRLIWSTEHGDLHIIDLGLLPSLRGQGVGTKVIRHLLAIATEANLDVRFYVEKMNPAIRLYERLGFKVVEDLTGHLRMAWIPSENQG